MTVQIALHELRVLSRSPFAWLAAGLLQLLFGWLFLSAIENYAALQSSAAHVGSTSGLSSFLIVHFMAPISIVFMVATPLLCMHLIAGEKQSNRFNLLLSLPATASQLVMGKFLGAVCFQYFIILSGVLLTVLLASHIDLDGGHLLTATVGLMLFVTTITAITIFYSSLAKRPVFAAFASFVTVAMLWIAAATAATGTALQFVSPSAHLHTFMQGLIDSRDISYFLAATGILLTLGIWRFDAQRVRGAQH